MTPKFINKKSKIYLVAPSFGCTTSPYEERLLRAITQLEKNGHTVIVGPNCFLAEGKVASNTPQKRADEFMQAYESDADCIISVGGGEMMLEILDYIDFEKIKNLSPKWFVGFSDNTVLTFTLTTLCDVETIYGCNAPSFHFQKYTHDILDTYQMLQGRLRFSGWSKYESFKEKKSSFSKPSFDVVKNIVCYHYEHKFSGTILGGNLDILQNLCGTPYDQVYSYTSNHKEGIIFYLEACDLSVLSIKRALLQLKRAQWFQNIKGFLIGRPLCINQELFGMNHIDAVTDVLSDFNVPILLDIDLGHIAPSLPMRNGAYATITYRNNNIYINYKN